MYERKYIVRGRQAYLSYVMFTFHFIIMTTAIKRQGTHTVSYTHLDVYKRQVEDLRLIDFGEDKLRGRGSLPATFYVLTGVKYLKIYLNFHKYPFLTENHT